MALARELSRILNIFLNPFLKIKLKSYFLWVNCMACELHVNKAGGKEKSYSLN